MCPHRASSPPARAGPVPCTNPRRARASSATEAGAGGAGLTEPHWGAFGTRAGRGAAIPVCSWDFLVTSPFPSTLEMSPSVHIRPGQIALSAPTPRAPSPTGDSHQPSPGATKSPAAHSSMPLAPLLAGRWAQAASWCRDRHIPAGTFPLCPRRAGFRTSIARHTQGSPRTAAAPCPGRQRASPSRGERLRAPRGVAGPYAALLAHRLPPRFAFQGKMIFLTADRCAAPPSASAVPPNHDLCRQHSPARVGTPASHGHQVGIFIFPGFWQAGQAASARWGMQN